MYNGFDITIVFPIDVNIVIVFICAIVIMIIMIPLSL